MYYLAFDRQDLELDFASHFGWRCRLPTFLLSFVLFLIWGTRLVSAQGRTDIPYLPAILSLFFILTTIHMVNTIAIYRNPAVCCGEKRKAFYLVMDGICCMVAVLFYGSRPVVKEYGSTPTRLIISTPFMVYGIHGWAGNLSPCLCINTATCCCHCKSCAFHCSPFWWVSTFSRFVSASSQPASILDH